MPVTIKKTNGGYRVSTPGGVKAKKTSKAKAIKQERLLNAVEHGWQPTGVLHKGKIARMTGKRGKEKMRQAIASHY